MARKPLAAVVLRVGHHAFALFAITGALGAIACSRKQDAPDASSSSVVAAKADASPGLALSSETSDASSTSSAVLASAPDAGFVLTGVSPVEARRMRTARFADEAALAVVTPLLDKHFGVGDAGLATFDVQATELTAAGRRALLVLEAGKPTNEARPILVIADAHGVVWSKAHPIAGIMPPVGPIAIAAAPLGRVAMAACDPPTNLVALRVFDDDGSPFADFQALSVEGCDALSLLYWPGRGWIVVAVRAGATRARLINENGGLAWGQGIDLGARSKASAIAPASLAADTDDTFVLVQLVQPTALAGSPFHALAFRYDTQGTAIWPAAVDLGELPRPPSPNDRATLARTLPGVRVTLPAGNEVDVKPSGAIVTRARAPR